MFQLIPTNNSPNQTFVVPLTIDGVVQDLYFTQRYNEIAGYWVVTVADAAGNVLLDSVPFVTAGNLLEQFAYLRIGSAQIINASAVAAPNFPNDTDLGTDFVLIWGDTPAA